MPDAITSFERINRASAANKAAAWKVYTPLTLEQLGKEVYTHDKLVEREPEDVVIVHRPTEIMALKHALYRMKFESEMPVERQTMSVVTRWCVICKVRHTLDMFVPDKRTPSGLSFGCQRGRAGLARSVFRLSPKGQDKIGNTIIV